MSGVTVFAEFELSPGKTLEEVRRALTCCIKANDADPLKRERAIDSSVSIWASRQDEHMFCASITHDPAKHEMQLVGIVPGLKSSVSCVDLVIFLHQADTSKAWTVCFVWNATRSAGKRSETSDPGEMHTITRALNALPLLLKKKLNH